jgi:hypothetical protein
MTVRKARSTRRAFFLQGSAVVGTGIASIASASTAKSASPLPAAGADTAAADRDAILALHRTYLASNGSYRLNPSHPNDVITLSGDGLRANARFHVEAEVCTPLEDSCTAAQMARLQGNYASHHWESGRFDAEYMKVQGHWKVVSMSYVQTYSGKPRELSST